MYKNQSCWRRQNERRNCWKGQSSLYEWNSEGRFWQHVKKRERRKEKKERRERKEKERENSVGGIKITWACSSCSFSCCCCCFSWVQIPLSLSLSHDFLLLLHLCYQLSQPTTMTTIFLILFPTKIHFF